MKVRSLDRSAFPGLLLAAVVFVGVSAALAAEADASHETFQIWITGFEGCHVARWPDLQGRGLWYHVNIDAHPNPYLKWETIENSPMLTKSGVFEHPAGGGRASEHCWVEEEVSCLAVDYDVTIPGSFAGLFVFLDKENSELEHVVAEHSQYALRIRMKGDSGRVKIELKIPGVGWLFTYRAIQEGWEELSIPLSDLEEQDRWPDHKELEFALTLENHALEPQNQRGTLFLDHLAFYRSGVKDPQVTEPAGKVLLAIDDPVGDDHGPGSYIYPLHEVFDVPGAFDIRRVELLRDDSALTVRVQIAGRLVDPWRAPNGFSTQLIDFYISTGPGGSTETIFDTSIPENLRNNPDGTMNAVVAEDAAWQMAFRVHGWEGSLFIPMASEPEFTALLGSPTATGIAFSMYPEADATRYAKYLGAVRVVSDRTASTISFSIPLKIMGETSDDWTFVLYMASVDWGNARLVTARGGEWTFGGGEDDHSNPNIVDLVVPLGRHQSAILDYTRHSPVVLPGVPFKIVDDGQCSLR